MVSACVRRNLIKLARPGHGHNSNQAAPQGSLRPDQIDVTPLGCIHGAAGGAGAAEPKNEQISLVTYIKGISFFFFFSFRAVRIYSFCIIGLCRQSISLYIVYYVKGFT